MTYFSDLNNEVEKVRADQQRLNHDLDFISSQQQELEDMLQPLEEKIKSAGFKKNPYTINFCVILFSSVAHEIWIWWVSQYVIDKMIVSINFLPIHMITWYRCQIIHTNDAVNKVVFRSIIKQPVLG